MLGSEYDRTIIKKVMVVQICLFRMNLGVWAFKIHGYYCQPREFLESNSSPDIRCSAFHSTTHVAILNF